MAGYIGTKEKTSPNDGTVDYGPEGAPKAQGTLKRQLKSRHIAMIRFAQVAMLFERCLTALVKHWRRYWHRSFPWYRVVAREWRAYRVGPYCTASSSILTGTFPSCQSSTRLYHHGVDLLLHNALPWRDDRIPSYPRWPYQTGRKIRRQLLLIHYGMELLVQLVGIRVVLMRPTPYILIQGHCPPGGTERCFQ